MRVNLEEIPYQGRFGAVRKYDVHTGLDIYISEGEPIYAIEDGTVVHTCWFTGAGAGSGWWNDTRAVLIEGDSGVILYGELSEHCEIGMPIKKGELIGYVKRVLKHDKGLPMDMLHIELYKHGYRGDGEWWKLNGDKPDMLLDVETLFVSLGK